MEAGATEQSTPFVLFMAFCTQNRPVRAPRLQLKIGNRQPNYFPLKFVASPRPALQCTAARQIVIRDKDTREYQRAGPRKYANTLR